MIITLAPACKKYEEGPAVSLKSKKERIANTWKIDRATDDGEDVTENFDQYTLMLTKDGDATLNARYSWGDVDIIVETDGTWEFDDKKEEIHFNYEDDDADVNYQILKLKEDELWLREEGEDLELHLVP